MANMEAVVFLLLGTLGTTTADYCREYYTNWGSTHVRTFHCSFGCCGPTYDEYCCVSSAGIIVGLVFAGIFGIAFITAIICCVIKKKGQNGRTVRPTAATTVIGPYAPNSSVFVVPTATGPPAYSTVAYPTPYSNFGDNANATQNPYAAAATAPLPPAYSQTVLPPPAYSYGDPAFPPTTTGSHVIK